MCLLRFLDQVLHIQYSCAVSHLYKNTVDFNVQGIFFIQMCFTINLLRQLLFGADLSLYNHDKVTTVVQMCPAVKKTTSRSVCHILCEFCVFFVVTVKCFETAIVYCPYLRSVETDLTICRCHYKSNTLSSVI